MFRSLTGNGFFCTETRLEPLYRLHCWREKDVSCSWNIINRDHLHERLVYNSRCFQETSSSFPCFQQVHYFELFCSVSSEVVFESSLLVFLVSSGRSGVSQIRVKSDFTFHHYFGWRWNRTSVSCFSWCSSLQIKEALGNLGCLLAIKSRNFVSKSNGILISREIRSRNYGLPLFPFGTERRKFILLFAAFSSFQSLSSWKQLREIESQM